ncbi:MAG: hypothetical protein ACLSHP_10430 [Coprococcus sp.]
MIGGAIASFMTMEDSSVEKKIGPFESHMMESMADVDVIRSLC